MFRQFVAAAVMVAATCVQAQVDVVESSPVHSGGAVSTSSRSTTVSSNQQAEAFYQMQTLQQEVLELRGLVEELSYEVKRLKQQRLDDYVDLDRRIAGLSGGAASTSSVRSATNSDAEKQSYDSALKLLRSRDTDAAIAAFNQHLKTYPRGEYAANTHYWLGETYLLKGDLESARQWFTQLLDGFPGSRKAFDAKYKLATVYYQLGDKAKSKQLLEEVVASNSNAARLARSYMAEKFSQ